MADRNRDEGGEEAMLARTEQAQSDRSRGGYAGDDRPSSAMGGTSDAGTAGDEAHEAAMLERGLPNDRTQWPRQTPGAGTGADRATRGTSGGQTPPTEPDGATGGNPAVEED